jgi:hypothetical protein
MAKSERTSQGKVEDLSTPGPSGVEVPAADAVVDAPGEGDPLNELFSLPQAQINDENIQGIAQRHIAFELAKTDLEKTNNVIFLFDSASITRSDADRIYRALAEADSEKPILLVLNSRGGDVAAAYFIAKLCRESTQRLFEVAVPRQAKSAATLICCGADSIHMGSLSELGPIDPQFGSSPALAFKHSVEHIAQLAATYPAARSMFSDYLMKSLPIEAIGYYERVAASAVQYAERLLVARAEHKTSREMAAEIATRLVYTYKDHGFAIDAREAVGIFGTDIVKYGTPQYEAANSLYGALNLLEWLMVDTFVVISASPEVRRPAAGCMKDRKRPNPGLNRTDTALSRNPADY